MFVTNLATYLVSKKKQHMAESLVCRQCIGIVPFELGLGIDKQAARELIMDQSLLILDAHQHNTRPKF